MKRLLILGCNDITKRLLLELCKDRTLATGQFAFGRHVMTCCEADIQFAGLLAYYAGAEKLSVGDWVEITAKVRCEYTDAYQEKGPVLYIRNLKKCEACKPEVATF